MIDVIHSKGWTFFPSVTQDGDFWEGTVAVYVEGCSKRLLHTCFRLHDGPQEALQDAVVDALTLAEKV